METSLFIERKSLDLLLVTISSTSGFFPDYTEIRKFIIAGECVGN
jgi:hypothetical protein